MIIAPKYTEEVARLRELQSLQILDTPPDVRYDSVTEFAINMLDVPVCYIALIDKDRQWFKSEIGLDLKETGRDTSICAHAICEVKSRLPEERIFHVPNTKNDNRFFDNPFVINSPNMISYLAYVLQSDSGKNLGTFCVVETKERKFTDDDINKVILLGNIIENLLFGRNYMSGISGTIH